MVLNLQELPNPRELFLQASQTHAVSVLNNFRHCLQERTGAELSEREKDILLKSIKINNEKSATERLINDLKENTDIGMASATRVWELLQNTINSVCKTQEEAKFCIEIFKQSLRDLNSVPVEDKEKLLDLVTRSIHSAIPALQIAL